MKNSIRDLEIDLNATRLNRLSSEERIAIAEFLNQAKVLLQKDPSELSMQERNVLIDFIATPAKYLEREINGGGNIAPVHFPRYLAIGSHLILKD